jgi:hypothetical protein
MAARAAAALAVPRNLRREKREFSVMKDASIETIYYAFAGANVKAVLLRPKFFSARR